MIVKHNKNEFEDYLVDASSFEGYADELLIPESVDEIKQILKEATAMNQKITISGAGTGLTGSRVPLGGKILSMERFNKILNFDKDRKTLKVESFVRIEEIADFLAGSGMFYPPNPTEKLATIGGNIGNNASGARTYKYGATRRYINAIDVVFPTGESRTIRRGEIFANWHKFEFRTNEGTSISFELPNVQMPKVKHAAGYYIEQNMDLIDLFIGAEGTLGVVTGAELQLLDSPEQVLGAIIFFDLHEGMFDFLNEIRQENRIISPRLIEFFDDNSIMLLRGTIPHIPKNAHYALWIEIETSNEKSDETLANLYIFTSEFTTLVDDTWIAMSEQEHKRLAHFRHQLPLAVYEKIQQYKQQKLGTDSAVPNEFVKEYYEYMVNLFKQEQLEYVIWGHIGNSHFHANILTKDEDEFSRAKKIYVDILAKAVSLGGTISAEHGIGKIKKEYLKILYSDEVIDGFRRIKKAFDPEDVLNCGNIF
ncbi:MAG: FAD-binding oxidoreductase [Bacteroidota bacterium]